jgi:hypothetical protein
MREAIYIYIYNIYIYRFDIKSLDPNDLQEDVDGMLESAAYVMRLVQVLRERECHYVYMYMYIHICVNII